MNPTIALPFEIEGRIAERILGGEPVAPRFQTANVIEMVKAVNPAALGETSDTSTGRSPFVNVVDYLADVPEVVPWCAQPLAFFGGVTLVAGFPKAGKSTLASQLMRARETGEDFLGHPVPIGPTVLLTEEGGIPVRH